MAYDAAAIHLKGALAKTNFKYLFQATKHSKTAQVMDTVRWDLLPQDEAMVSDPLPRPARCAFAPYLRLRHPFNPLQCCTSLTNPLSTCFYPLTCMPAPPSDPVPADLVLPAHLLLACWLHAGPPHLPR